MKASLPFRAWYYFRTGYSTYLAFMIATVNTMVTVYYLAIKNIPDLQIIFPSFTVWVLFVVFAIAPLAVLVGWLHMKRSPAFRSEMDVTMEANPYYYKLPPGYWREALVPAMLETIRLNLKVMSREPLTEEEKKSLRDLQAKLQTLIDGGFVGQPTKMSIPEKKA